MKPARGRGGGRNGRHRLPGQAMVEYVLLLLAMMTLVLAIAGDDPFLREYFSVYFDRVRYFVSLPIP